MSTFTQFNAPGCVGPSGKDLVAYQTAFTNLLTELHEHIATKTTTGADVHSVLSTLTEKLSTYIKLSDLQSQVQTFTEDIINNSTNDTNKLQTASAVERKIADYYTSHSSSDLAYYVPKDCASSKASSTDLLIVASELADQLSNYLTKAIAESTYATKEAVTTEIENTVNTKNWETLLADVITANNYLKAKIQAVKTLDFIKWSAITASFVGTGGANSVPSSGLYVLGCISLDWFDSTDAATLIATKSGRAYVKYVNTDSLDAVIDWAITKVDDSYTGAITANVSKKADSWQNLRFHICVGTAGDDNSKTISGIQIATGTKIAYLCVSADNLIGRNGDVTNLQFFVAGENFIPRNEIGYAEPNGMATEITSVYIGGAPSGTFAASSGQFNDILSSNYLDANGTVILKVIEREIAQEDGTIKKYNYLFIGGTDEHKNYDQIVFTTRPCLVDEKTDPETGKTTEALTYFVTADDIANMVVPIGVIFRWSVPDKIPEGFLKCDGSQISAINNPEYANLCELLGTNEQGYATLPEEYNSIIKYKYYSLYDKIAQPDYTQVIDFDILNKRLEHEASVRSQADNALDLRVKSAEDTVSAFDTELNDTDNGLKKRVETVETDLNDTDNGLKKRVETVETDLNDTDNGLKKKVADNTSTINANKDDADTKISNLDRRVSRYENVRAELEDTINLKDTESKARDKVINDTIGELIGLDTTDKSSVVAAINELNSNAGNEASMRQRNDEALQGNIDILQNNINAKIGELTDLDTAAKSTVIAAINELKGKADTNTQGIADESNARSEADAALTNALTGLINNVGLLEQLTTAEKESIVAAINELNSHIGDIATLSTENKGSVVEAINELDTDIGDTSKIITGDTTSLVAGLNNESNRRQNADRQLQSNIENEATARGDKDTELDSRVTALENRE